MDGNNSTDDVADDVTSEATEEEDSDGGESEAAATELEAGASNPLSIVVEALEGLTNAVETLSSVNTDDAQAKVSELATELRGMADRLAGAVQGTKSDEEASANQPAKSEENKESISTVLASVHAALQNITQLLGRTMTEPVQDTKKAKGPKKEEDEDELEAEGRKKTTKGSDDITAAVRALVDAVKGQQQRLARMEKRFGLPNSLPPGEGSAKPIDHNSWPMDLNDPMDRESIDKSISFHEV